MLQPDIKGSIIRNSNPEGCHHFLAQQWDRLNSLPPGKPFKSILVIGSSSGFGLASRLAALRNGAKFSLGVCFERAPNDNHSGSAGWHLDQAFHSIADTHQHISHTVNQDAFLVNTKQQIIDKIKSLNQKFDLVIYSLAAGVKIDAKGEKIRSSILPTEKPLCGYQVDLEQHSFTEMELPPANKQQIADTVNIMGGGDWQDWMNTLSQAGVLEDDCETYNYSYLGSELNAPIYRDGTLGAAKIDMHKTASRLRTHGFNASAVVCKALVTKASLFIPLMAPYLMALKAELKKRHQDENAFDQMRRLLAGGAIEDDSLLRLDNYELDEEVQAGVKNRINSMTVNNFKDHLDYEGVREELLQMHGF